MHNGPVLRYVAPRRLGGAVEPRLASSAAPLGSSSPQPALPLVAELEKQKQESNDSCPTF